MADYTVIADVSRYLLTLFRDSLCPLLLPSREQIALGAPDAAQNDSMLLLYLYSLVDYSDCVPEREAYVHSEMTAQRPMPVELRYVIFFNRRAQTPLDSLAEHRIWGKVLQMLHDNPVVDVPSIHPQAGSGDRPASLRFSKLEEAQKQEIWNGFSEPMRPAVYIQVEPLLLSGNLYATPRVRELEGQVERR